MTIRPFTGIAAMLVGLVLATMPAAAQAQSAGNGSSAQTDQPVLQVTPQKLDAFARAVIAVNRVGAAWRPRIQEATSKSEAERLLGSAQQEMKWAVENQPGITLSEYAAIAQAAQQNLELKNMIAERVRAAEQGG